MNSTTSETAMPTHIPVLLDTVVQAFDGIAHDVHVDGTTGLAGHLIAMLETYPSIQRAIAVDMDPSHLSLAQARLASHGEVAKVTWKHAPFRNLKSLCEEEEVTGRVSSILLDLGLCSAHVDLAERGFSFLREGPLDMRFDTTQPTTAATLLSSITEEKLADLLWKYGDERYSRKIARAIVMDRKKTPFTTTTQLADLISRILPSKKPGFHPATKTFQALRIAVNDELTQIEEVIESALQVMKPGGRLAVITYHSLEDRIVKHAFKDAAKTCICPRELPQCVCSRKAKATILTKKPILPTEEEKEYNPRSRSAKLRILEINP